MSDLHRCWSCSEEKPSDQFDKTSGMTNWCIDCERQVAEDQRRERRERFAAEYPRRLKASRLPGALQAVDFPTDAPAAALAWGDGKVNGVCLTGGVGVGKTHIAAAATRYRLRMGHVRWVRVAQLMTQLRASFGDSAKEEAQAVIAGTGAVVLDDLDKVNPTEFGREVLFCAIDGRVQEGAPLLVTTNLPISEIAKRLGEPIASRLAGYCEVVRMTGEDRRLS
jgi:DNA replication protein DnaC